MKDSGIHGMQLRVATYNIRKCIGLDWRRNPERVIAVVEGLGADVVALQEADRRFGRRMTTLSHVHLTDVGYAAAPIAAHDGGIGWHGNAILLRDGIAVEAVHRITLPALEPRGAVVADLDAGGVPLRIVGTHLGLTHGMRMRQARAILHCLDKLDERPTIVMGDMNNWHPTNGCIAAFAERFRFAPPASTFHASKPVAALDRIAVTGDIEILERTAVHDGAARVASDHLPLWADVRLGRG